MTQGPVLDRIHIPEDMRQKISERLTPGSSLIIGDKKVNSATLPDGADFLVLTKDSPAVAANPPPRLSTPSSRKRDPSLPNGGVQRVPTPTNILGGSIGRGFFAGDGGEWPVGARH